ncbi:transcriptional regulator [Paenibacillus chitinolyticus]|uniref:Transcriptional regulator n=1 Tax=Paenibacillus chitinolyticus TaxID=79263 RepID=A0A410X471_9BACL|nr:MarR family transcriptional regulator [Paenibacillus chitinolyticus]MCY9592247.1 MarR family transcriptional regulator [Paenibacillus chitinolyticus]MCY9598058.1 MarR family transcriptional regulator [Paenibacillus chitinolyticus]QAV21414.1 transcriptional regulator [Paenibacillus chitinolyticus]
MEKNKKESFLSKQEEKLGVLIWFRLSRVYNQSIRQSNQHLKAWNLSAAQFDVLVQVGSHERLTQQELADKLLVTKGNITQLLGKMEELGWIRREQEWKTKYISLTAEGQALFDEVVPQQEQFQASQFDGLDREEKKQLLELLKKVQKQS